MYCHYLLEQCLVKMKECLPYCLGRRHWKIWHCGKITSTKAFMISVSWNSRCLISWSSPEIKICWMSYEGIQDKQFSKQSKIASKIMPYNKIMLEKLYIWMSWTVHPSQLRLATKKYLAISKRKKGSQLSRIRLIIFILLMRLSIFCHQKVETSIWFSR